MLPGTEKRGALLFRVESLLFLTNHASTQQPDQSWGLAEQSETHNTARQDQGSPAANAIFFTRKLCPLSWGKGSRGSALRQDQFTQRFACRTPISRSAELGLSRAQYFTSTYSQPCRIPIVPPPIYGAQSLSPPGSAANKS